MRVLDQATDSDTGIYIVRVLRKVDGVWKFDSLLEDSPLAEILATTEAAELRERLVGGEAR